jgi:hypothetical protein
MLMLYSFHICTHDISRLRFIDFEESGVCVELSLCPSSVSLAEDIIMCMAEEFVHVFRLGPRAQGGDQQQESEEQQHRDGESYILFLVLEYYVVIIRDCAIAQAVSFWHITMEAWV